MLITFNSNATSLTAVEDAFYDIEDVTHKASNHQNASSSLKDDTSDSQPVEGREEELKWIKSEVNRQFGEPSITLHCMPVYECYARC
jgi:hypothetical protein